MPNPNNRQRGLRLFVCLEALLSGFLRVGAEYLPGPVSAVVITPFSWIGYAFILCALFGLVDLWVNDFLDSRHNFWVGLNHRNDGYLILAGLYGAVLLQTAKADQLSILHIHVGIMTLACAWVAVMDVIYRYLPKEPKSDFSHQLDRA